MHARIIAATAVLLFSLIAPPAFAADATTSPGQKAVFVAHQDFDGCCHVSLNGQIAKGQAHNALMLDATFMVAPTTGCSPTDVGIFSPQVNGIFMNPDALGLVPSASARCQGGVCPTITGTYWLDLDAAEAAYPGMFVHQPLNITLSGTWFGVTCSAFNSITMSAVMVRK